MNILVVCQHYWPEPFNVHEVCESLSSLGHSVSVVTGLPNYPDGVVYKEYKHENRRFEKHNGIDIRRCKIIARGANLRGVNKFKRIANYISFAVAASSESMVRNLDYDVVLCIQYSPILMAIPALKHARRHNKPCVIYCYDLWPEDILSGGVSRDGKLYAVMKRLSRRIYSQANLLAVTSPGFAEYFDTELGLKDVQCVYLPQYAENQFVELGARNDDLNARKKTVDIVFAGNVGSNQGIENVVKGAVMLKDHPAIRIHIVGSGSRLEACEELANKLKADNVVFHGRQPLSSMPQYYDMADAMLLVLSNPNNGSLVSKYTIPRKLQSYLAAGKPVLVSAEGTVADMASKYGFGLCSRPDSPQDFAAMIVRFVDLGDEQRRQLKRNSRRAYEEEFTKSMFLSRLVHALEGIA